MKQLLFSLICILTIIGCTETDDLEKPKSNLESPTTGQIISTNLGINLIATLTDNTGLLQYKVVVAGIDSLNGITADSTFSAIYIEGIENQVTRLYLEDVIALDSTTYNGHYTLTLSCVDIEGNESLADTVSFRIKNSIDSEPPVINAFGPLTDTLFLGSGFSPNGTISDAYDLVYASVFIGSINNTDTTYWFDYPVISGNEVVLDGGHPYFVIDSTWNPGLYHVNYTAWDNHAGVSKSIPFYVSY